MSTAPIAQGPVDVNVSRQCACHPDDNPPSPCAEQYAIEECRKVAEAKAVKPRCPRGTHIRSQDGAASA